MAPYHWKVVSEKRRTRFDRAHRNRAGELVLQIRRQAARRAHRHHIAVLDHVIVGTDGFTSLAADYWTPGRPILQSPP